MKKLETLLQNNTPKHIFSDFLQQQLQTWELANTNYQALKNIKERIFSYDNFQLRVQFNPARITSTKAKIDTKSIQNRACFLCKENRPAEQNEISFSDNFYILVNPFPILPQHFTLVKRLHQKQMLIPNLNDMLKMAQLMEGYTLFYNGAKCGASAPDHMHFQAGSRGFMPIDTEYELLKDTHTTIIATVGSAKIRSFNNYLRKQISIETDNTDDLTNAVTLVFDNFIKIQPKETEPMLNVIANFWKGKYTVHLFPRRLHRPTQYFAQGEKQLLISPGAVEFGGIFSTPRQEDFEKITSEDLIDIFQQICIDDTSYYQLYENIKKNA